MVTEFYQVMYIHIILKYIRNSTLSIEDNVYFVTSKRKSYETMYNVISDPPLLLFYHPSPL